MIHYNSCPVCNSNLIKEQFAVIDYTVSKKSFWIWQCNACTCRFTQDVPSQDEISVFYASDNYISHSDTKKGLVNSLYHFVRKRTLISKKNLVKKLTQKEKGTVLDIGCGTGAFLHTMTQAGWSATGLEPDENAREKALKLYDINVKPSSQLFNLAANSFDAITLWHVLEHVHDLHLYLEKIAKLLTPTGKVFIAVPNYTSKDAAIYEECWAAYDVPRHLYHFSPESMKKLMRLHGLEVKGLKPMWYDSFYVSMLSEKYKKGNGNIFNAIISGIKSNLNAWQSIQKCSSVIYVIEKKSN